jgi:hypothetical protein
LIYFLPKIGLSIGVRLASTSNKLIYRSSLFYREEWRTL